MLLNNGGFKDRYQLDQYRNIRFHINYKILNYKQIYKHNYASLRIEYMVKNYLRFIYNTLHYIIILHYTIINIYTFCETILPYYHSFCQAKYKHHSLVIEL